MPTDQILNKHPKGIGSTGLMLNRVYDGLLEKYVPNGFLVNDQEELLHIFGDTSKFLKPKKGRFSGSLLTMIESSELMIAITSQLRNAEKQKCSQVMKGIRFRDENGADEMLKVTVDPIIDNVTGTMIFTILIEKDEHRTFTEENTVVHDFSNNTDVSDYIKDLELQVQHTKESLNAAVEELETSNEELQATNEELLASNEELQSTNEELHSVNEELYSVNAEHELKIEELNRTSSDLHNLMNSIDTATIFVDSDFHIRLFTPKATQFFNLIKQDVGRDLRHFQSIKHDFDLFDDIARVLATSDSIERDLEWEDGITFQRRCTPYSNSQGKQIGVVINYFDTTNMTRINKALEESEARLSQLLKTIPNALFLLSTSGKVVITNDAACEIFDETMSDIIGQSIGKYLPNVDWNSEYEEIMGMLKSPQPQHLNRPGWQTGMNRSGDEIALETRIASLALGEEKYLIVIITDIRERLATEIEVLNSEKRFRTLFDSLVSIGVQGVDSEGRIFYWNKASESMFGYAEKDAIGRKIDSLIIPDSLRNEYYESFKPFVEGDSMLPIREWNLSNADGGDVPAQVYQIRLPNIDGKTELYYVEINLSVIKRLEDYQQRLEHLVTHDPLTGLPNRVLLADRFQQAIHHCNRNAKKLAVAYIDLDGFKEVNDSYGHLIGDKLLIQVGKRLASVLRLEDTLARLGGDEFVVLLVDLDESEDVHIPIRQIIEECKKPYTIDEMSIYVSLSIGISFYPQEYPVDADQIMRQADFAMYRTKQSGKNGYEIYDPQEDELIRLRNQELAKIRSALSNNELEMYYQPRINMRTGEIKGLEALLRWNRPDDGTLPPGKFLPVVTGTALEVEIGNWVVNEVVSQLSKWNDSGLDTCVSMNISPTHLNHPSFVDDIKRVLEKFPTVNPGKIELEILENSEIYDLDRIIEVINECRKLGLRFSMDDFGSGYSSLTYIKHFPIETVKIDRSFIANMMDNPDDLAIVRSVIGLANAFNLQVVAEGVETIEQGIALIELGCHEAQGYCIERPNSAERIAVWFNEWKPREEWTKVDFINSLNSEVLQYEVMYRKSSNSMSSYLRGSRTVEPNLSAYHEQKKNLIAKAHQYLSPAHNVRLGEVDSIHQKFVEIAEKALEAYKMNDEMALEGYLGVLEELNSEIISGLESCRYEIIN